MKSLFAVLLAAHVLGAQGSDRYEDMTVVPIGPLRSSLDAPKGIVWKQEIRHPGGAAAIRVHIVVPVRLDSPDWAIRIRDLAGRHVDTFQGNSPLLAAGDVWSSEIRDSGAVVELVADVEDLKPGITIDRYAFRADRKSSIGPGPRPSVDTSIPIFEASFDVQGWAEPVARLRFIQEGQQFTCTGFLVHPTLILTAAFCGGADAAALSLIADFAFDSDRAVPKSFRVKNVEVNSTALGYALLRLADVPFGFRTAMLTEANAVPGQPVVVIQHPGGGAKKVSSNCSVTQTALPGAGAAGADFGHDCFTIGGSSGSPVIDRTSGRVLGLHHLGATAPGQPKQAVQAALILADLKQRAPEVYAELTAPRAKK